MLDITRIAETVGGMLGQQSERPDLSGDDVGYFGRSWGGQLGGIIPAVAPRLDAVVLWVAGLPFQKSLPEVDAVSYLPRITQPVLMINGEFDPYFPLETSQRPMFERLGTPEEHKKHVVDKTGHFVSDALVKGETLRWFDRYLGPVE